MIRTTWTLRADNARRIEDPFPFVRDSPPTFISPPLDPIDKAKHLSKHVFGFALEKGHIPHGYDPYVSVIDGPL